MMVRVPPSASLARRSPPRHPGLPGWRSLLGALAVVALLALVLHLLYL
jgi:anti-sigma-K factor RskA